MHTLYLTFLFNLVAQFIFYVLNLIWIGYVLGGARSLSVFDNDIGSGSISPLIVTGGKGGDIGLHDFRYIATGRTKRHKHLDTGEHNIKGSSIVDMRNKTGDQNRNGMLWYIPKAHSGTTAKDVFHLNMIHIL